MEKIAGFWLRYSTHKQLMKANKVNLWLKTNWNAKWISTIDLSSPFAEKGSAKIIHLAFRGPDRAAPNASQSSAFSPATPAVAQTSPGACWGSISWTHARAASLCCFPFIQPHGHTSAFPISLPTDTTGLLGAPCSVRLEGSSRLSPLTPQWSTAAVVPSSLTHKCLLP